MGAQILTVLPGQTVTFPFSDSSLSDGQPIGTGTLSSPGAVSQRAWLCWGLNRNRRPKLSGCRFPAGAALLGTEIKIFAVSPPRGARTIRMEESAWGDDDDSAEHDYYNSIPGKEPPLGGVVDSRLRHSGAMLGHIHTQPQSKTPQVSVHQRGALRYAATGL